MLLCWPSPRISRARVLLNALTPTLSIDEAGDFAEIKVEVPTDFSRREAMLTERLHSALAYPKVRRKSALGKEATLGLGLQLR